MATIEDHVLVHAPLAQVYAALATETGVRGWWNQRAKIAPDVGGESSYRFHKGGNDIQMRFRNAALDPRGTVEWSCVANDNASWVGTTVRWTLTPTPEGTAVKLDHAGFDDALASTDGYRMVVGGWRHFVGSLKSYVETGKGQPFE
jgi:uncharacterized protein YndB with AHSA1/START domain